MVRESRVRSREPKDLAESGTKRDRISRRTWNVLRTYYTVPVIGTEPVYTASCLRAQRARNKDTILYQAGNGMTAKANDPFDVQPSTQ